MKRLVNFNEMLNNTNTTANEIMEMPFVKMVEVTSTENKITREIVEEKGNVIVKKKVGPKDGEFSITYPMSIINDKFVEQYHIDDDSIFSTKDDKFKSGNVVNLDFGNEKFKFIHTGSLYEGSAEQFIYDTYGNIKRKSNLFSRMEEVYDYDFNYGFEGGLPASMIQRHSEDKSMMTMITLYTYNLDKENEILKQYKNTILYNYDDEGSWVDTSSGLTENVYRKVKDSNIYLLSVVKNNDEIESQYEYFNKDGQKII